MPLFGKAKKPFSYEIIREGEEVILMIDLEDYPQVPSLESDEVCMAKTVEILIEAGMATKIVFAQKRNYEYDTNEVMMLREIADIYVLLSKRKEVFSYGALMAGPECAKYAAVWYPRLQTLVSNTLKGDPIGCYVEIKRIVRDEKIRGTKSTDATYNKCSVKYMALLQYILNLLEKTRILAGIQQYLEGYKIGDRTLYARLFSADIRPDFMFTKLMATYPHYAEEIDSYEVDKNTEVTIFELPDNVQYLYHLIPPEFKLSEDKYEILDAAKKIMSEHKPTRADFIDPTRIRQVFTSVGRDLIEELSNFRDLKFSTADVEELTKILVRYTVGFGLIEVLLQDEKIQDITINSPMGETPVFIVHQDYSDCRTNIVPTAPEAESWASKLRLISGRPLDEANPIMDTELELPGASARVAVISSPLNPSGLAYALRRHRDKPWTLPLFIKNGMLTPLAAGIISFLVDGNRTLLVAGTRSSGKTSLLGSVLVELMRKYRVITIEDSVTPDSTIYLRKNGRFKRLSIGMLIDTLIEEYGSWYNLTDHEVTGNPENMEVLSMNKQGKIIFSKASKFIRHKVKKPVFEIQTRTGRKIKVTGDHSLFGIGEEGRIAEVKASSLKINDFIAVPRKIDVHSKNKEHIDVFEDAIDIDGCYFTGEGITSLIEKYKDEIKQLGREASYTKSTIRNWLRKSILPVRIVKDAIKLGLYLDRSLIYFKYKNSSHSLPIEFPIGIKFLVFAGLWIADGSYDKSSVIISCNDLENRKIVEEFAEGIGLKVRFHSDKVSYMLNSKTLKVFMKEMLDLRGNAYTKRIPEWVFSLSKSQIACVLRGIFSADGRISGKEIVIPLASINLLNDLQFLLSLFSIMLRIGTLRKDKTYNASISNLKSWISYKNNIGVLQEYKRKKLEFLCSKISTHDTTDVIPLNIKTKEKIWEIYKGFNRADYITKNSNIGRGKLASILELLPQDDILSNLDILTNSDIFWDAIKSINVIEDYDGYVYDISVPECESFVCNNIVAHNTLELPVTALRKLGYNIQHMKVASALTKGTTEVSADEGIRTTLRLGDSALIVGEIRSKEALALYEAMRVGALANVVAGTIHGDSPYGVFDRVVNDLGVPRTSFKATDIIIVANPVRSADGLHRWRRVTQISEIRKRWEQDPLLENGFVDLMKYNSRDDKLLPTADLINGDSEIIKSIAGNVKDWSGNWDSVWDNINLRANIKEALVNFSAKAGMPELLEAPFVIQGNDQFHKISDKVKEEIGVLDSKKILFEWNEWLRRYVKKKALVEA